MEKSVKDSFPYFDEIKRHLAITWNDDETNQTVKDYITDGQNHLMKISGDFSIDFNKDIEAKKLLKEYCRYARNYSIEAFNHNFQDDILRFQIHHAIDDYSKTSDVQ